jgi:extradiol dioxygenase family protein
MLRASRLAELVARPYLAAARPPRAPQAAAARRHLGSSSSSSSSSSSAASPAPPPFHLAIPVSDLAAARAFYGGTLGLQEGRASKTWQDYALYQHQLVCHEVPAYRAADHFNPVDRDDVPVPHFGVCLSVGEFHALAARCRERGVRFVIEPHLRFAGKPGEQWTMFFKASERRGAEGMGPRDAR